ncbi:MAG: T9SS type A sorting domain-containing protein [Bacteroidota bacterium]
MKKLYLAGLLSLGIAVNAQQASKTPVVKGDKALPAVNTQNKDYEMPSPVRVKDNTHTARQSGYGKVATWTPVGSTFFDRQTNSSVYRRILAYADGKVSVNWTTSSDNNLNNFLGRGSGYNHFDGTAWGPVTKNRIELLRAGYPNMDYNGSTEIIMSHRVDTNGKSGGLIYNTNGAIGSTTWTSTPVLLPATNQPSVLWPRTVVSGDYMHVLANYTSPAAGQTDSVKKAGVKAPTVYSRYKFSTSTWEVSNITLPGYDSTRWFDGGADGYAIDANGANVAVMLGGSTNDITLWKSADNGSSWTSTIIDSFAIPAFNDQALILDTPEVCDGSMSIKVDGTGKAHCFWGRLRVLNTTVGDNTFSVFLGTNSIDYWYEGRPDSIVTVGAALDFNNDGTLNVGTIDSRSRYGNAGVSTMPYTVVGPDGTIYLIYSSLTEDDLDAQGAAFRDIFITFSKDNGATWSDIQNLTSVMGFNKEQVFGSAAIANGKFHLTFMESDAVGFFSSTDNPNKTGPFDILYYTIPVSEIEAGKVGLNETTNTLFTAGTNYPNPFNKSTIIPVNLTQKADVKVTVMNVVGEVVYTHTFNNTTTGVNELEVSGNFKSGFYFYNVEAGGFKTSGKMLAE